MPKRRLRVTGFVVSLSVAVMAAATLLSIQHMAALWGEGPALERGYILTVSAICLVAGVWQGYRANHALAREFVRFRQLCRKRRWVDLFGFPVFIALFAATLGVFCSLGKWLPRADENAGEITLVYAAMFATAGFIGAFAQQFTPIPRGTRR